ncbi:hypothetical protein R2083_00600 [Nitrosomonas sp. Is35]|uniref:hypothetical protein n=1 Tax=Nitrosomonas sp. Is35 TaxID=3080534 RepID=UPI00294AA519|nr:hypothetical protein [Nitrosomonas sp. Is35]MDV6346016.1 hypothetical protein [Nitrosomonas sp. Is35]
MATSIVPRSKPMERGVVLQRTLQTDSRQKYFLYVPRQGGNGAKIFITVHGISRNVRQHAKEFVAYAERYGVVMIAPYFPSDRFPDYQRLGRKGNRADIVLNAIVAEVAQLTGASSDKLYLFGYSGGAQFVHRYMFAYPERVARIVLGAPGWYTLPDASLKFPIGIQPVLSIPQVQFNSARFLNIPVCVLVGEKDNRRDAELNKSTIIDRLQGKTRIERGRHWVEEMSYQARLLGLPTTYAFHLLPDSPHSFAISMERGDMGDKTFNFLFPES